MNLVFFNHYGIGDLWESREFVREWMQLCGVTACIYACRYPAVFEDMPEIQCIELQPGMNMRTGWERKGDTLMVNTWVGARNAETRPKGDYVLWPGVGCTVENIHRMHLDYQRESGFTPIDRPLVDYIPNVDYSRIDTSRVDEFIYEEGPNRKILICNGPTGSGHASNFDMSDMVALIEPQPITTFFFTEKPSKNRYDWAYTDDATNRQPGECDVLKISYLSRFCDVIVGRCSGAQMPCETRENWLNPKKTLVSFTQHRNGACFVRNPEALGLQMKLVHSPAATPQEAAEVLRSVL